jgi:hypothetical protein
MRHRSRLPGLGAPSSTIVTQIAIGSPFSPCGRRWPRSGRMRGAPAWQNRTPSNTPLPSRRCAPIHRPGRVTGLARPSGPTRGEDKTALLPPRLQTPVADVSDLAPPSPLCGRRGPSEARSDEGCSSLARMAIRPAPLNRLGAARRSTFSHKGRRQERAIAATAANSGRQRSRELSNRQAAERRPGSGVPGV